MPSRHRRRGPEAAALERYLHENIPLSRNLGIEVREATHERVVLGAPLAPNLNHRGTFFGGSAVAVCTLAAWGLAHSRCRGEGLEAHIVIQRSRMEYLEPAAGTVDVVSVAPGEEAWRRFADTVRRKGKGRVRLEAEMHAGGQVVGRFEGSFVALRDDGR